MDQLFIRWCSVCWLCYGYNYSSRLSLFVCKYFHLSPCYVCTLQVVLYIAWVWSFRKAQKLNLIMFLFWAMDAQAQAKSHDISLTLSHQKTTVWLEMVSVLQIMRLFIFCKHNISPLSTTNHPWKKDNVFT